MNSTVGWREYMVAGGIAGMVSRTVIAPIERVKIIYQVKSGAAGFSKILPTLLKDEGVLSLWKGNTAAVVRVVPYLSVQMASNEEFKALMQRTGMPKQIASLLGGSLAGMTAVVLTYPLDMVRARMAMQNEGLSSTRYTSMFDALKTIRQAEGIPALYRGMTATLAGAAPYTGLKFAAYDSLKSLAATSMDREVVDLPGWVNSGAGAGAGFFALTLVYPFDVIRRRMQTHQGGSKYPSVFAAFRIIAHDEGIQRGLYRGLTLNYLKTLPNVAIYLSLYDFLKKQMYGPEVL